MHIHNASYTLNSNDLLAFSKPPRRFVFHPGEQLFRFGSIQSATFKGNAIFGSPWWIPEATFNAVAKTAHRTQSSLTDVARSRLAVATPWNPTMEWLMVVELKKAVYGWLGPTRPQPLDGSDRSVLLLGNYDQVYVPGLGAAGATASDAATLVYFGSARA
jgi:hypothetical protein